MACEHLDNIIFISETTENNGVLFQKSIDCARFMDSSVALSGLT